MNNVLITGGAGFIGSWFVRHLLIHESDIHIVNLDALTYAGNLDNLTDLPDSERHTFVHGDISDQGLVESILREQLIDTIVHFAAESHVDRSIAGPARFIETNILGTFSLLEATRRIWMAEKLLPLDQLRFHHISTDEVYGSLGSNSPAFSESTSYAPNSPYAASKAASDHLARAYAHTYGLPVLVTNCSNNYGPYQFPEKLIPMVVLSSLEGKPIPIYGDGQQVRNWVYVEDQCEALLLVLRRGRLGESYNTGGNEHPTNLAVVETVCEILDEMQPNSPWVPHQSLIQFVEDRPGHDRRYAMDSRKIEAELNWHASTSLREGLEQTVGWYLTHPDWISAVRRKPEYQEWLEANYAYRTEAD